MDTTGWVTAMLTALGIVIAVIIGGLQLRRMRRGAPVVEAGPDEVAWQVEHVRRQLFRLRNVGSRSATGVVVKGRPPQSAELIRVYENDGTVPARGSLEFGVMKVWQLPEADSLAVTWDGHPEPEVVPIPPDG